MLPLLLLFLADEAKLAKMRPPRPAAFALVFSAGYAGDHLPKDDEAFGRLLAKLEAGGFNVVHGVPTKERLALCRKHGIKLMADLLAPGCHVYNEPEKAKALCESLRGHPDVWGYNVWNDPFGKTAEGRRRDILNVRKWDGTHPVFCGTYRTVGMKDLDCADCIGWYDFHWKRGPGRHLQHLPHLLRYRAWAEERDAVFLSWLSATSGLAGKGNFNRSLWSANTLIAAGGKGIIWFLGPDLMDMEKLEWTERGRDILKVQERIAPLAGELGKLGTAKALYATPATKDANDKPFAGKHPVPAIPEGFFLKAEGGEFLLGDFGKGVVFLANQNAYRAQEAKLRTKRKAERFAGKWTALAAKDGTVTVALEPGGGALLRLAE
ncbi:MAG: hypothetical protein K2W96_02765 [Gemmataceae bacterium]|nr:hypothetical protein [Gemmataceae bacterium]